MGNGNEDRAEQPACIRAKFPESSHASLACMEPNFNAEQHRRLDFIFEVENVVIVMHCERGSI